MNHQKSHFTPQYRRLHLDLRAAAGTNDCEEATDISWLVLDNRELLCLMVKSTKFSKRHTSTVEKVKVCKSSKTVFVNTLLPTLCFENVIHVM